MSNVAPFEVIAGPLDAYFAATGTAPPTAASTDTPGSAWTKVGYTNGGVKVAHTQTVVELRADQTTAPIKATRSEEGLEITFSIVTATLANYALALNQAIAGPTGDKVYLYRGGFQVETIAMLFRNENLSPLGNFPLQYFVPVAYQADNPEASYTKDNYVELACSFHAISDPNAVSDDEVFGWIEAGTS